MKNSTVPSFLTTGSPLVSRSTHRDGAQAVVGNKRGQKKGCSSHPYSRLSAGSPLRSSGHTLHGAQARETPARTVIMSQHLLPGIILLLKAQPCRGPVPARQQSSSQRCAYKWDVRAAERRHGAVDRAFIKQVGFGSRAMGVLDPASLFLSSDASTDSTAAATRGLMIRTAQRGQRPPRARNARSRLAAGSPRGTAFPRLTAAY